ncbi:MAG: site-2 protease family protein [Candidatus Thermoplasmatota archaeon]
MVSGWLIALGLLVLYVAFVVWLVQSGRMAKWNLSLMLGFALMVRTHRGKRLLDAIARPRRLWAFFGDLGTVVTLLGMALMAPLMVLLAYITLTDSRVEALAANEILVIPGVNPFVPLWYGLIALIITLVVHEGGHGVLARANGMRVKSLGLLFAVVPIGAFVEPDEDDLKAAPRRRRLRVFSAGPGVNLACAALFLFAVAMLAGATDARPGMHVALAVEGAPSDLAGIGPGDTIQAADGIVLPNWESFRAFMETKAPGDNVTFTMRAANGDTSDAVATLGSRWDSLSAQTQEELIRDDPAQAEDLQNAAYLGVYPLLPEDSDFFAHPFESGRNFALLTSAPIGEVRGQPMLSVYLPAFYETPFDADVFWVLFNLAFWIFWLNLMVGLTNILPLGILDGGHIFRDAIGGLVARVRPGLDPDRQDRVVKGASRLMSWVIGIAFLVQIFGPRLVSALA